MLNTMGAGSFVYFGLLLAIGASFLWGLQSKAKAKSRLLIPGLKNHGNNCFLNVILQALASCGLFLEKLVDEFEVDEGMAEETLPLTFSLAALLQELSAISLNKVVLNPKKVMVAMANYTPNFSLTSQQDAAEAFSHLLCSLKEEILYNNNNNHRSLLEPFDGILGSILTCQTCSSQISSSSESFQILPLSPLLKGGDHSTVVSVECTLLDCLKQFLAIEKIENYRCSYCSHNNNANYQFSCSILKQLSIVHYPKILCIQLNRVSMNNVLGDSLKVEGHICFPMILDMSTFVQTEEEDLESCNSYRLVSVVEHFGGVRGGHYIVYRRVDHVQDYSLHTQWFHVSDSQVHFVSEEVVLAADASLLFYERI